MKRMNYSWQMVLFMANLKANLLSGGVHSITFVWTQIQWHTGDTDKIKGFLFCAAEYPYKITITENGNQQTKCCWQANFSGSCMPGYYWCSRTGLMEANP